MSLDAIQNWMQNYLWTLAIWAAYLLSFAILEWRFAAVRGQPWRDIGFNLHYLLWNRALTLLLTPPLTAFVVQGLKTAYPSAFGWTSAASYGHLSMFALVYYLAFDGLYYAFHRLQHTWPLLWRQHVLHHSDRSLNVTTSGRHHWLEEPLRVFVMALPLAVLFDAPPVVLGFAGVLLSSWGFFIHANIRLNMGPLTLFLCGPQVHRIHHSCLPQHRDKNFAAFFPIWDWLFGTYYAPKPDEFPHTGVDGVAHRTIPQALFSPFGYPATEDDCERVAKTQT